MATSGSKYCVRNANPPPLPQPMSRTLWPLRLSKNLIPRRILFQQRNTKRNVVIELVLEKLGSVGLCQPEVENFAFLSQRCVAAIEASHVYFVRQVPTKSLAYRLTRTRNYKLTSTKASSMPSRTINIKTLPISN